MHIALVTAGGAGMFCGSCMHDNTWARALHAAGCQVTLIPTYTPIRVDEEDESIRRVFFGGINVYLDERLGWWGKLPAGLVHWLDAPWILKFASRLAVSVDAEKLGTLTLAMLKGDAGPEQREVNDLVNFLAGPLKPDVICFSNILLCGALPALRKQFAGPIACVLQGDDVFLEALEEPYRRQAIEMIEERARGFDAFIVHSRYYRDFMSGYLNLPVERFHQIPLGIDLGGHTGVPKANLGQDPIVGYFARICPEKGLINLVEAFRLLHRKYPDARLHAGGYLSGRDSKYFREVQRAARELGERFSYVGSPGTMAEKVKFLTSLDVFSVPTVYREPKGLYVLEAMANGIPVAQPRHGAFPELIDTTGGGVLVTPGDAADLANALEELLRDSQRRLQLARQGYSGVRAHYGAAAMATATVSLLSSLLDSQVAFKNR